jgi:AP-3 complex subunit beta
MSLARYDVSYDIRDRMRLLRNVHESPLRSAALHTPKPVPRIQSLGDIAAEWELGSLAQVIASDTVGQFVLPEWGSEIPEAGVRDIETQATVAGVVGPAVVAAPEREEKKSEKKVWKDLDKFYASESEEEASEEESEETEESEEDGEEVEADSEEAEEESEEESETDSEHQAERGGLLSLRK